MTLLAVSASDVRSRRDGEMSGGLSSQSNSSYSARVEIVAIQQTRAVKVMEEQSHPVAETLTKSSSSHSQILI